jgi:hypothetical protein
MAAPPAIAFCACCTPSLLRPQSDVLNRPGLSAISYRVGSFATFRQALLESIASEPRLAALTSRADDEYAVTLIELFAAMGDVLTFYNERIANELFLRTARERDSVLRLVRLIGYRLRPGLAATAMLAYSLDAGAETRIRRGLKVMSVPGQDEQPQTFETLEQIVAHADLNEVPAFAPPLPFEAFRQGSIAGPIVSRPDSFGPDDRFVVFGLGAIEEKKVESLKTGHDGERLAFAPPILTPLLWPGVGRATKVVRRLRFFGHNASASHNVYLPANPPAQKWPIWTGQVVNGSLSAGLSDYPLDGRYDDLQPGAQLLVDAGPGQQPRLRTAVVTAADTRHASLGSLEDSVTHVTLRQTIRGRPALAAFPSGHLVFARSGSGAAQWLEVFPPRRWTVLEGAEFTADLAITITAASRLDVLVRDAARTLRQRRYQGGWGAWVDHGGFLTSEPRPLLLGASLRVFVRGLGFGLWMIDATAGTPGAWIPLGGLLTSPPAPVSPDGIGMAVFVRGPDRALWLRRHDGAAWSAWESLGGVLASGPAVASSGAGRIDVVARGDAGNVLHRSFDGLDWSDWRDLGGDAVDEPAIVAAAPNRVDIFVRSSTGELRHIARDGANWSPWFGLEGKLTSAPAALRDGPALHVYARGADGAIVHRSWTGTMWQPWLSYGDGLGAIAERRATRIYEISPNDIEFRPFDYPTAAGSGQVAIRLTEAQKSAPGGLDRLAKGRRILFKSGSRQHLARVTATRPLAADPGGPADHLLVDFAAALPSPFPDAVLLGNIAEASHGETQPDEPLGHGDAAQPFQKFTLQRAPVTYLPSAAKIAGEAALEIRVNGERWTEVPSLYGRAPKERIYTARQSDEGETTVTFGDGRTGARLPSGALNVVARYRKGLGLVGRMKAGQLSTPLERPPGLRAVVNPFAADGGADPEKRDDARYAAPGTVRTFGRAVSLLDFEWIATTSGLVQRAYVTWVWHQLERAVHLTVAAPAGEKLSVASLQKLYAALNTARDPNRQLFLANLVRVPVVVRAKVVADTACEPDAVRDSARAALLSFFAFEAVPLGQAVHASSVYAALQAAQGVVAVDVDVFHLKGYADLTPTELASRAVTGAALQPHIRIFPARPAPPLAEIDRFARAGFEGSVPPPVLAAEQAYIADPLTDIELTLVGAL